MCFTKSLADLPSMFVCPTGPSDPGRQCDESRVLEYKRTFLEWDVNGDSAPFTGADNMLERGKALGSW